jgi:hypothetical protein
VRKHGLHPSAPVTFNVSALSGAAPEWRKSYFIMRLKQDTDSSSDRGAVWKFRAESVSDEPTLEGLAGTEDVFFVCSIAQQLNRKKQESTYGNFSHGNDGQQL